MPTLERLKRAASRVGSYAYGMAAPGRYMVYTEDADDVKARLRSGERFHRIRSQHNRVEEAQAQLLARGDPEADVVLDSVKGSYWRYEDDEWTFHPEPLFGER